MPDAGCCRHDRRGTAAWFVSLFNSYHRTTEDGQRRTESRLSLHSSRVSAERATCFRRERRAGTQGDATCLAQAILCFAILALLGWPGAVHIWVSGLVEFTPGARSADPGLAQESSLYSPGTRRHRGILSCPPSSVIPSSVLC